MTASFAIIAVSITKGADELSNDMIPIKIYMKSSIPTIRAYTKIAMNHRLMKKRRNDLLGYAI
ncbi:hypothetical protein ACFSTH_06395 [Paenibacillus yanchengensis]